MHTHTHTEEQRDSMTESTQWADSVKMLQTQTQSSSLYSHIRRVPSNSQASQ